MSSSQHDRRPEQRRDGQRPAAAEQPVDARATAPAETGGRRPRGRGDDVAQIVDHGLTRAARSRR